MRRYFVYIMSNISKMIYTGMTNNPDELRNIKKK